MQKDDHAVCFGVGVLLGVMAGVVSAVLYAPKSGEDTRKDLENVVTDLSQKYAPEVQKARKQALNAVDTIRYKLEREYNKLNDAIKAKQLAKAKAKESIDYEIN